MKFLSKRPHTLLYVPDGVSHGECRATHLCVAAHQDDVEIMAYAPIAECYDCGQKHFMAVTLTDGGGSPRTGRFARCTDEEMIRLRMGEQQKAAELGRYCALAMLGHTSNAVKGGDPAVTEELAELLLRVRPQILYTHNLADKHDTHVATALRTVEALRLIRSDYRPERVYMMEVWRGLDWLCEEDKALFDTSPRPQLAADLLDVFESQIEGGKSYRSAALGRRIANATFFESHRVDGGSSLSYGLDATDFVYSPQTPQEFIGQCIARFREDVQSRLERLIP